MSSSLSFEITTSWTGSLNQALQIKTQDMSVSSKSDIKNEHISFLFEKNYPKAMFSRVCSDASCLICLEVINLTDPITLHPCSHYLHTRCHLAWLSYAASLKCEYCQLPTSCDFLLKLNQKTMDAPWKLIQSNKTIMNSLFSFLKILPRLDPGLQLLILEALKFFEYLIQKSEEAERSDFSSIKQLVNESVLDIDAQLNKLPQKLTDTMVDVLSSFVVDTLGEKWFFIKKDFFSFIIFPISAAFFVSDNKKMYFLTTLFKQLTMPDSSIPVLKNMIKKFNETVDLKVYQCSFKKLKALNGFQFFKTIQTMQEEEYLLLKRHAKGEEVTCRKIQFMIKLNESLKTVFVVFYLSLFAYLAWSSFLDKKKTN